MDMSSMSTSSSRILYDVPCAVCRDHSSGKHYGVFACDGCAGFFKRSIRRDRRYSCKARKPGVCLMDKTHRNQCRACRLAKCLDAGMNKDAVQNERGPRNSTIRRQMALFLKDPALPQPEIALPAPTLNLAITKHNLVPSLALPLFHNPYSYSHLNLLNPAIPCLPRIPSPPRIPSLLSPKEPEALCEAAASLLFMNVEWAKNIPAFASLSLPDRLVLLEETWKDLFVIGSAQFIYPTDLNILYDGKDSRIPRNEIEIFQTTLSEIVKRRPDNNEYSCLRAVALFKTSFGDSNHDSNPVLNGPDANKLQDFTAVATFHDHSRVILNEYSARTFPLEISRGNELLKLLPLIRLVSSFAIVELFFRATIGEIPIERIICDMYRTNKDKA